MFNFSKYKYYSLSISVLLIIASYIFTFVYHKGYAHSLDFNGGLRAVVDVDKNTGREDIERFFKSNNIEALIILLDSETKHYQIDIGLEEIEKIKKFNKKNKKNTTTEEPDDTATKEIEEEKVAEEEKPKEKKKVESSIDELLTMLRIGLGLKEEQILSGDQVGAVVGGELSSTGLTLLVSTMIIMTVYLGFRFQLKFAVGATVALIHDLLFTLGLIGVFQIKPSVPLIAALLTILGYSINDTIVIFDRIRENSSAKIKHSLSYTINLSITQTLTRTLNTSLATLISIVAIVIGGAVELYDFAYVLILGIFVGTYSSIFIAAPVLEIYEKLRAKYKKS